MTQENRAVYKIFIRGSIDDVWHQVTKKNEPQECFFNCWADSRDLKVGERVCMRSKSKKYTGVVGTILECDPPRRYAQTFRFTHLDDPECKVIYDLEEVEGGVEFRLTLEDLTPGTKTAKQMNQGATMILNTLKNMVEKGRPSFGTRLLFILFRVLEPTSPKRTLSTNWPVGPGTE